MIRVILFGAQGRMGRLVTEVIHEQKDMNLVAGVEHVDHPMIDQGNYVDGDDLPQADVWIDFSVGEAVISHLRQASIMSVPLIIAATGYNVESMNEIRDTAKQCPILLAPNLSIGIGVMDRLIGMATQFSKNDFDPVVFEMHHTAKKDAPSGTAKKLAETIATEGREAPISSLRAGGAIGEHRVHFVGQDEELIITHRASSRQAFASGVPRAVRFIVGCAPGLYSIRNMFSGE
jgi:4-hydroxy-tetrahydrodipicolinate reductase